MSGLFDDLPEASSGLFDDIPDAPKGKRPSWMDAADQLMSDTALPAAARASVLEGTTGPFNFKQASAARRALEAPTGPQARGPQYLSEAPPVDDGAFDAMARIGRKVLDATNQGTAGIVRNVGDITGLDSVSRFARGSADASRAYAGKTVAPDIQVGGFTPNSIVQELPGAAEGAAVSIGTQLPAIATGNLSSALALLFGQSYGDQYNQVADKGLDTLPGMANAGLTAAFEVIGEKVGGLPGTINALKGAIAGNAPAKVATEMLRAGARDVPGEMLTTTGQYATDALPGIGTNESPSVAELGAQLKDTVLQTVIQGGMMTGGGAGIAKARELAGGRQPEPPVPGAADYQAMMARVFGNGQTQPPGQAPVAPVAPVAPPAVDNIVAAIEQAALAARPKQAEPELAPQVEPDNLFADLPETQPVTQRQPEAQPEAQPDAQAAPEPAPIAQADAPAAPPAGQPAIQAQATGVGRPDAPAGQPQPEQPAALTDQPDAPVQLGYDSIPLSDGGKPFKTQLEAKKANKTQQGMRVVKAPGGGFMLIEQTAAQRAAYAKAARRVKFASVDGKGSPESAHGFLIGKGGLDRSVMADAGFDRNPRFGNRTLFAGKGKQGLTLEQATQLLREAGYITEDSQNAALDIIKRSVSTPQYTPEGWERIAEAESEARFTDFMAGQEEAQAGDRFADPLDLVPDYTDALDEAQAGAADEQTKRELAALLTQAEAQGIDTESLLEDVARQSEGLTDEQYTQRAIAEIRSALTAAPGGRRDGAPGQDGQGQPDQAQREVDAPGSQDNGAQGNEGAAAELTSSSQGGINEVALADASELTSPTRADIEAQQDRIDQAGQQEARDQASQDRQDREQRSRRDIAQRSEAAADSFELGQDANDNLSGQGGLFGVNEDGPTYGQPDGKNAITGDLARVNPAVRDAVEEHITRRAPEDQARIRRLLEEHKSTAWAAAAVKGMAYREMLERAMEGRDTSNLEKNEIWGKQDMSATTILKTFKKVPQQGDAILKTFVRQYAFIGNNRKAENDVSTSFSNCEPSKMCAKYCYAAGSNARPSEIAKSETTEYLIERFPELVAAEMELRYRSTAAGQAGLALRINDKGDLSPAQVKLIAELNKRGIATQVFSKRPELLRELSDINLKMLSIDDTNMDVATANPDLRLAVIITDGVTEAMLKPIHDRVSVYLPVNLKGKKVSTEELKARFPGLFKSMRSENLCPVDGGKLDTKPGTSFVDIKNRSAEKGVWTCTTCDLLGNAGCFKGERQTNQRKAAAQAQAFSVDGFKRELAAKNAMLEIQKQLDLLKKLGALDERQLADIGNTLAQGQRDLRTDADTGAAQGAGQQPGQAAGADGQSQGRAGGDAGDTGRAGQEGLNVEAPRTKYADERQLELDLDAFERDGPVSSQAGQAAVDAQREASAAVLDLHGTGTLFALSHSRDLAARQRATLVGQQVSSPEDLATLAQVYRDPRFETFRVVFVNDAGKVVSQVGLTQRLPAAAATIIGSDFDGYLSELGKAAANVGATGYYMLHNHPSGNPTPSRADQSISNSFFMHSHMKGGPKFKAHVVIDTNKFAVIDKAGDFEVVDKDFGQPAPMAEGEFADMAIRNPGDLMDMAKRIAADDDAVTLVVTDYQLKVKTINTVPRTAITADKDSNRRLLTRQALQSKGSRVFAISRNRLALSQLSSLVQDGIEITARGEARSLAQDGQIRTTDSVYPQDRRTRVTPDTSPEFAYLRKRSMPAAAPAQRPLGRRLREDGPSQTATPAFKRWFGDSKVVDAQGKPLVVYHETISGGTIPEDGIATFKTPTFFSSSPKTYFSVFQVRPDGFQKYPVYVALKNPKVTTDAKLASSPGLKDAEAFKGHDGVILKDDDGNIVNVIAFKPEQIKSATGNNGQFDPADSSIVRENDGEYNAGPTAPRPPKAPKQTERNLNPFGLDKQGRVKFRLGELAFHKLDAVTKGLQVKTGMAMANPELRRQLRQMKATIEEANRSAADVAKQMSAMTEVDRELVSDLVEKMVKPGTIPPEHAVRVADSITRAMDRQTDELVELGMLTPASADRWRGKYLPRIYSKHMHNLDQGEDQNWLRRLFKGAPLMRGVKGDSLKARGMFEEVSVDAAPQWLAAGYELRDGHWKMNQGKLELVDKNNTPWLAREKVVVWRDFTQSERLQMGEMRDAMLRYVQGYTAMQRDIAMGRLFDNIANNTEWTRRSGSPGWSRVPDTEIPDTGGVKRYGNLAGLFVRDDVMTHLTQFGEAGNNALQIFRQALGLWKEGKTALNPVAHFNNIVSNVSMAHFAGVSYWDSHKYINAVRDLVSDAPMVAEGRKVGLFTGSFTKEELMQALPKELQDLLKLSEPAAKKAGRQVMNALTFWLRTPMRNAYEFEDVFFKYVIYRDARQQGLSPEEATDLALKYIFTYDDLPRGARIVRDTAIPFFAWTYKAIPALLHTAAVYPWRFLAPAAMLHGINLAAYALAAGDEDDDWLEKIAKGRALEEEERKVLPERMLGSGFLANPKSIRLGTDQLTGHPVFMDVSRIVPGGDMFDMTNQAGGVPLFAPIMPNHPVLSAFSAMIVNREMFMGRDITDKNDTGIEAAEKRAKWMAGFLLPAVAVGGYHSQRIADAAAYAMGEPINTPLGEFTGVNRSGQPVQPSYAAMNTLGVKARPIDLELEATRRQLDDRAMVRSIAAEVRSLARLQQRGAIGQGTLDREVEKAKEKLDRIRDRQD